MTLIEKIKYVYIFILFILLLRTLIFSCLKISDYIVPVFNYYRKRIGDLPDKTVYKKIAVLSFVGIFSSIVIFSIIADSTFINVAKEILSAISI